MNLFLTRFGNDRKLAKAYKKILKSVHTYLNKNESWKILRVEHEDRNRGLIERNEHR